MTLTMEQAMTSAFEELLAMDSNDFIKELFAREEGDISILLQHMRDTSNLANCNDFTITTMKLLENIITSTKSGDIAKKFAQNLHLWQLELEVANDSYYLMAA